MRAALTAACLLCIGCAAHKPVSTNWRVLGNDSSQVLVPPGVAKADLAQRTLKTDIAAGKGHCPPGIRVKGRRVVATVNREQFQNSSADGWLASWAAQAESQGCIAAGQAPKLAARAAEALPLDPQMAFHALYPADVVPPVRLQVVSPILKDEAAPVFTEQQTAGKGNQLAVTLNADNLIGYETALYAVQPKALGPGYTIAPLYADRRIDQTNERHAQPATDYFRFPVNAAFFRLFVKSGQTAYTALAIAAPTRAELASLAAKLDAGASCETLGADSCIAIPRRVALNAVVPVTINGTEVLVRWGANLAEAMRGAGERQPEAVLATLAIERPYNGRPTRVDFERSSQAILRLPLAGGEVVSWKRQ
ncbi:MAG TPA: hypothetical protein VHZ74_23230 [Bryobacteraceae bacterium]|nr:hypothetical protein [Bryobacteraceae bacterium]